MLASALAFPSHDLRNHAGITGPQMALRMAPMPMGE
jgi:hypothetical protein